MQLPLIASAPPAANRWQESFGERSPEGHAGPLTTAGRNQGLAFAESWGGLEPPGPGTAWERCREPLWSQGLRSILTRHRQRMASPPLGTREGEPGTPASSQLGPPSQPLGCPWSSSPAEHPASPPWIEGFKLFIKIQRWNGGVWR